MLSAAWDLLGLLMGSVEKACEGFGENPVRRMGQPVPQMRSLWSTCSKRAYGSSERAGLLQPDAATMQS